MAVPWLRLLDTALGLATMARSRRELPAESRSQEIEAGGRALGGLETRLAGVVVAALKEAFDRDTRRLELEREQLDAERRRAERALKLELLRQAADREIGRFRLLSGVAVASWIGTLFFASRFIGGAMTARVLLGAGWALLLAAIAASFAAQAATERAMRRIADNPTVIDEQPTSGAGQMAPWLIVVGLALVGAAVLVA
jgi:F0F1-type ATP synthase membrane subunit c/vacuolar-type H+-ATPase subunit K